MFCSLFLKPLIEVADTACLSRLFHILITLSEKKCLPRSVQGYKDFVIVRFLMKLCNTTNNMDIINNCRQYFDVKLPSIRFEKKFAECNNIFFCKISVSIR